ncbi:sigma-54-dependent Fis family transcriptional regulator [Cobetia amphilecti]|nr:sigma-54-dependent Fis family transcriptional regulator [Cobetia litoralis]
MTAHAPSTPRETRRSGSDPLPTASVLIVDDEPGMRRYLEKALSSRFALIECAESVEQAEALRSRLHFDLILLDIRLPGRDGLDWDEALAPSSVSDVIFMTAYADLETAVRALRAGACDFIIKPFRLEQLQAALDRCLERRQLTRENFLLRRDNARHQQEEASLKGESPAMLELAHIIARVAPAPSPVLILGESGTGKELAARDLHRLSGRRGAFVPVNCGAISPELLESELFGHLKGAFTGAHRGRDGLFSFADGGTLFLDEIGEMPLAMQAKLLRVLETRRVRPVGGEQEQAVDVRIVAATHRTLETEVAAGRFREDLYYRLNVLSLTLPALRERPEDIPALAQHFSRQLSRELNLPAVPWQHSDLTRLCHYSWPGNVRELKNVIERALLLGRLPGDTLPVNSQAAQAPGHEIWDGSGDATTSPEEEATSSGYPLEWSLDAVEKAHLCAVLERHANNKSAAARQLGISRKTLDRKLTTWRAEQKISEDSGAENATESGTESGTESAAESDQPAPATTSAAPYGADGST